MRTIAFIVPVMLLVVVVAPLSVNADEPTLMWWYTPTATDYTCNKVGGVAQVQYMYQAARYEGPYHPYDYALLKNCAPFEWVATGVYNTAAWYAVCAPPTLIPYNATINSVALKTFVAVDTPGLRNFRVDYAVNETKATIDAGTAVWHNASYYLPVTTVWPNYLGVTMYVTDSEAWSVGLLRNSTWVRVYTTDASVIQLLVDYVGLEVSWYYPESAPPEGEGEGDGVDFGSLSFDIAGIMGITGVAGMIALPAVAVWMWRNEHGDRMHAFIMLIVSFMVCFTLFLGSLG